MEKNIISDLNIDELIQGYTKDENNGSFQCIFCGKEFEEGVVYFYRGRSITAQRAMEEHIYDEHGGPFESLLFLDKEINGLTDIQKNLLLSMYEEEDNKTISEKMDVKASTVRTHKFKIQEAKRQAKILLALFSYIENTKVINKDKQLTKNKKDINVSELGKTFKGNTKGNTLHPFFTQVNLK